MITLHAMLIGQPQTITDTRGEWRSSIFRTPITGPVELGTRGLAGDQVTDTKNHGSPDQAVCCHPLVHYDYWNAFYADVEGAPLGPGSVGENWTLAQVYEDEVCIGDIFEVGTARVQISAPRYPCSKQERKVRRTGFLKETIRTRRTGWYLRVLTPGMVQAGDMLDLEARPNPAISVERVNRHIHATFDHDLAHELLALPELADTWKQMIQHRLES